MKRYWIRDQDNNAVGISFGYDFTAEHEEGIKGLLEAFDVGKPTGLFKKKLMGVDKRRMKFNKGLSYGSLGDVSYLSFTESRSGRWLDAILKDAQDQLDRGHTDPVTYWGKNEFLIASKDHDAVSAIEKFITSGDALITLSPESLGVGLVIHSINNLPAQVKTGMMLADEKAERLDVAVKKEDAAGMLEKHGKKYFALSPSWNKDESGVIYWLNPYEQSRNNSGWYTFNELKQWTEGTGPIPAKDTIKS